jgi:hypothetical protein
MKMRIRITSVILAVSVLCLSVLPCLGAGEAPAPEPKKMTVSDPQFIPLSDEQVIPKAVPWYYYVLGIGALAGVAGGGGGGDSGGTSPGSVTIGW